MIVLDISSAASGFSDWISSFSQGFGAFLSQNSDFVAVIILFIISLWFAFKIMQDMGGEGGLHIGIKFPRLPSGIYSRGK